MDNSLPARSVRAATSLLVVPMALIERWLWPVIVFLMLCWFVPWGHNTWTSGVAQRQVLLAVAVGLGLAVELLQLPPGKTLNRLALRRHLSPLLAVAFGVWTLIASGASDYPIESLTGTLRAGDFGALWYAGLSLAFVAVYMNVLRVPSVLDRIQVSVVFAGLFLSGLALAEVLAGRSLVIGSNLVPVATFMGPGHLAGALVLSIGMACGILKVRPRLALVTIGLVSVALGATGNRTGAAAVLLVISLCLLIAGERRTRYLLTAGVTATALILGNFAATGLGNNVAQAGRSLSDATSISTRVLLAKAAVDGIRQRPVYGFGGGDAFSYDWYKHLSREDLNEFLVLDHGFGQLIDIFDENAGPPVFVNRTPDGAVQYHNVYGQKIHNQYLDFAIMWGLVGLGLFLAMLLRVVPNALSLRPAALAVVAVALFLTFWFSMYQLEGALWIVLAAASVRPVEMDSTTPAALPTNPLLP